MHGTGNIARLTKYVIAFIAINLTFSITATYLIGWSGPLWGTLAGFILVKAWAFPYVLRQTFGWRISALCRQAIAPMLWAAPYMALLWYGVRLRPPATWLDLVVYGALSGLGTALLWWLLGLTTSERHIWRARWQLLAWGR